MSPLIRIPLGIAVAFLGYLIVRHTDKILSWFGRIPTAELKLGPGSSRTVYKLLGFGVAMIGAAISTNVITNMLESLAGFLTNT